MNLDNVKYDTFETGEITNKNSNNAMKYFYFLLIISSLLIITFIIRINSNDLISSATLTSSNLSKDNQPTLSLSIYNPNYETLEVLDYIPWDYIAEPYKTNYATVDSMLFNDESLNVNDYSFVWTIDGVNYEGKSINFQINKVDVQTATITATKDDYSFTTNFKLAIKYVRREIRSLTNEDRENFLNTLNALYTTSKSDGVAKYGSKFVSAEDFSYKHLNGAARVDCDHWHDGAGIVNHHVAYTLEIEQALQAIDPSISMPYWEYAMDSTLYDDWQDSPIFNDDWFGDNSPGNDLHELNTGRWGDILVPSGESYIDWSIAETSSLNPFVNGRGHLRSPWNNNPSRYIGRYNSTYGAAEIDMPTCDIVYECYRSTELGYMLNCLNGVTHGPVHVKIGGAWDNSDLFTDGDVHFLKSIDRVLVFKLLWRTGYTRCPASCGVSDDCACSIPQQYLDSYGAKAILENSGVWDVYNDSTKLSKLTDSQLLTVLEIIQDPGVVGDMFTSAASFDPLFWPVHGQIERVIGLKRIKLLTDNIPFTEDWSFSSDDNRVLNGVCDWSGITSVDDLTLPNCDFSGAQSCWGHNADDLLEWSNFINNNESYTNKDFYDFIHPWNEKLPYVYDTYGFSYCDPLSYPFD